MNLATLPSLKVCLKLNPINYLWKPSSIPPTAALLATLKWEIITSWSSSDELNSDLPFLRTSPIQYCEMKSEYLERKSTLLVSTTNHSAMWNVFYQWVIGPSYTDAGISAIDAHRQMRQAAGDVDRRNRIDIDKLKHVALETNFRARRFTWRLLQDRSLFLGASTYSFKNRVLLSATSPRRELRGKGPAGLYIGRATFSFEVALSEVFGIEDSEGLSERRQQFWPRRHLEGVFEILGLNFARRDSVPSHEKASG